MNFSPQAMFTSILAKKAIFIIAVCGVRQFSSILGFDPSEDFHRYAVVGPEWDAMVR
jgi:hypothetical protein